jgi:hypothetical protein
MVNGLTPVLSISRLTLGIGRYPCTGAQVLLVISNETNGPIIESVSIGQDIKEYEDHLVARKSSWLTGPRIGIPLTLLST